MMDKEKQIQWIQENVPPNLTPRQREILQMIAKGISAKQIALHFGLSPETVRTYKLKTYRLLESHRTAPMTRPPFNAEYLLYFLIRSEDRDAVIGDLIEGYGKVLERFNKRRADIWFYKQVGGSLFPLFRRALLRIGALVWLGRILRRLIS
jgi:hypothetical protein